MPIERQISEIKDYGLKLSPGTIFGGLKNLYLLYLEPLYQSLPREIRNYSHYHIDRSGWHLFVLVDDKEILLFVLYPTRFSKVPYKILFDIEPDEIWIERIGNLYHLNNERIKYEKGEEVFEKYDAKLKGEIGEIDCLTHTHYSRPAQNSLISSMKEHWKGLSLFVEHLEIPMDNNIAERVLRHMVLGRNNYWGNHPLWAGG